jgi:hypothetical protein
MAAGDDHHAGQGEGLVGAPSAGSAAVRAAEPGQTAAAARTDSPLPQRRCHARPIALPVSALGRWSGRPRMGGNAKTPRPRDVLVISPLGNARQTAQDPADRRRPRWGAKSPPRHPPGPWRGRFLGGWPPQGRLNLRRWSGRSQLGWGRAKTPRPPCLRLSHRLWITSGRGTAATPDSTSKVLVTTGGPRNLHDTTV